MDQPPRRLLVGRMRNRGFFVVDGYLPGMDMAGTLGAVLGLKEGYQATELAYPGDPGPALWVAWVEEEHDGKPNIEFRLLDGSLPEEEVARRLASDGQETLALERCPVAAAVPPPGGPEAQRPQPGGA